MRDGLSGDEFLECGGVGRGVLAVHYGSGDESVLFRRTDAGALLGIFGGLVLGRGGGLFMGRFLESLGHERGKSLVCLL